MTIFEAQQQVQSMLPKIKELRSEYQNLLQIYYEHEALFLIEQVCEESEIPMDVITMPEEEFNEILMSTFSLFSL